MLCLRSHRHTIWKKLGSPSSLVRVLLGQRREDVQFVFFAGGRVSSSRVEQSLLGGGDEEDQTVRNSLLGTKIFLAFPLSASFSFLLVSSSGDRGQVYRLGVRPRGGPPWRRVGRSPGGSIQPVLRALIYSSNFAIRLRSGKLTYQTASALSKASSASLSPRLNTKHSTPSISNFYHLKASISHKSTITLQLYLRYVNETSGYRT